MLELFEGNRLLAGSQHGIRRVRDKYTLTALTPLMEQANNTFEEGRVQKDQVNLRKSAAILTMIKIALFQILLQRFQIKSFHASTMLMWSDVWKCLIHSLYQYI